MAPLNKDLEKKEGPKKAEKRGPKKPAVKKAEKKAAKKPAVGKAEKRGPRKPAVEKAEKRGPRKAAVEKVEKPGPKKPAVEKAKAAAPGTKAGAGTKKEPAKRPGRAPPLPPFPIYLEEPKWGAKVAGRGGTSVEVVLGPAACDPANYGSKASAKAVRMLGRLKKSPLSDMNWIAGHLLNDNMGGSGADPANLTPLTSNANKRHSGIELKVKAAVIRAKQVAQAHYAEIKKRPVVDPKQIVINGIFYSVTVGMGRFGPTKKLKGLWATNQLLVTASVVCYGFDGKKWVKKPAATKGVTLNIQRLVKN